MILFIDDEEHYVRHYIDELRIAGYDVVLQTDVDAALAFFDENCQQLALLILDIMMSPGASFDEKLTVSGRRTGVFFYERVRQRAPDLPIIMLSNVSELTSKVTDTSAAKLLAKDARCWFYRKRSLLPIELREEVERITGG